MADQTHSPQSNVPEKEDKIGLWAMIREDVACVFERDPAARTTLEVLLTYPGVHAILFQRIAHRLWKKNWRFSARFIAYLGRLLTNIDIHPGATIGRRFFIDHGAGVVIGETAEVGNDVTLYHGVTLGGTSWRKGKRHPSLEDGVVVGSGAKILGPITVREQAKVGANSVVIEDVPPTKTVVGIPGKIVNSSATVDLNPYGVDLNHHLIPDPVADAISCLMERIRVLEQEVAHTHNVVGLGEPNACPECELEGCLQNDDETGMIKISKIKS